MKGCNLWSKDKRPTLSTHSNFSDFMNRTCFFEINLVVHFMEDESVQLDDDWWKIREFTKGFNKRRVDELHTGVLYVLNKSMSPMVPTHSASLVL